MAALATPELSERFNSPKEVVDAITPLLAKFESRLDAYENNNKK